MPISAFKIITPTSIVVAGGTASVGQFGKVSFSAATSLSLNGVFSSTYDNYMIAIRTLSTVNGPTIRARLRVGGTDNTTASSYVYQFLQADSTLVQGTRATGDFWGFIGSDDGQRSGAMAYVFAPYLTQPTAFRTISGAGYLDAWLIDYAGTHNQSTAYDGITVYQGSGSFSGEIAVYGCNQ